MFHEFLKVFFIDNALDSVDSANKKTSSAKRVWEMLGPLEDREMGVQLPLEILSYISKDKNFIPKMNK